MWLVHSFAQVKLRFAKLDTGVSLHSIEGKGFQRDSLWLRASSFSTFAPSNYAIHVYSKKVAKFSLIISIDVLLFCIHVCVYLHVCKQLLIHSCYIFL